MIINKLILKNFRIFNGAHEFDFSNSKVVVIEGPNGHGKSTIFDAINWVLSGKIDRYTGSSEYQQFNYLINNTAYQGQSPYASVEIILRHDDKIITIKRLIRNSSVKLYINSVEYGLKEGQKVITKLLVKESRGELIEGLGVRNSKVDMSAFLASTTILSQEGLENFVRSDKPIERYAILERVLGLTRYGVDFREFLKKIEKGNEEKKVELEASKAGLIHEKEVLEAKYDQKKKHDNRLGKLNKDDLIRKVNGFFVNSENIKEPISITEVSEKELLLLKKAKEKNLTSIDQLKAINESIKRNYLIDVNSESVEINIKDSKKKSIDIKVKINKRIKGLKKIEIKEKELINTFEDVQKIRSIEEQIQKKVLKIEEVSSLKENILVKLLKKYNQEELNDIAIFDEKYEGWKYSLDQNNRMLELSESREKLKVIESKRGKNEQSLKELIIQRDMKTDKINELNLILNELRGKQTSKKESYINRLVNEIQEKILSSENVQSCMVCGTYFDTENELKETVRNQLKILSKDLDELDKQVREKELMKGSAISEKEEILKDIKKYETELNLLKSSGNEVNEKVAELLARIDLEIMEASDESFRVIINELESLVNKYQYKYNLAKEFKKVQNNIEKIVKDKNIFIEEKTIYFQEVV